MRLWSLHPGYLDAKGLLALWREGLLAKAVLEGKTRGYQRHPQLIRFRNHPEPLKAIQSYLWAIFHEASRRGYHFDKNKLSSQPADIEFLTVTSGQLAYERQHLLRKLQIRDTERWRSLRAIQKPKPHPLFTVIPGGPEAWEKV